MTRDHDEVGRDAILIAAAVGSRSRCSGRRSRSACSALWGWGQRIREDGPHTHLEKMGTPTMGGIVIARRRSSLGYVATRRSSVTATSAGGALGPRGDRASASVGFLDDFIKVRRRRSLGLSKTAKFARARLIVSVAVRADRGRTLAATGPPTELSFIRDTGVKLGLLFYLWVFIILAASSNAVNLTDGLDGLASGSSILVLLGLRVHRVLAVPSHVRADRPSAAACYPVDANAMLDLAIVAAAAMGAVAGFLWWNAAPARIFMGDTGALALGGLFGALAITTNTQLLLLILGGLFVIETMSVILQVISFRGFGRRIFRMSPIHHHFELAGWPEFTVIVRFWIVAGLCVAVGLGSLLRRLHRARGARDERRGSRASARSSSGAGVSGLGRGARSCSCGGRRASA